MEHQARSSSVGFGLAGIAQLAVRTVLLYGVQAKRIYSSKRVMTLIKPEINLSGMTESCHTRGSAE